MTLELFSMRNLMMGTASFAALIVAIGVFQAYDPDTFGDFESETVGLTPVLDEELTVERRSKELLPSRQEVLGGAGQPRVTASAPTDNTDAALVLPAPLAELEQNPLIAPAMPPLADGVAVQGFALAPKEADRGIATQKRFDRARAGLATGCTAGTAACQPGGGAAPLVAPTPDRIQKSEASQSLAADSVIVQPQEQGRDRFEDTEPNQIKVTAEEPVSTFSIDVDTASYAFMRGALMNGVLPPKDAVRIEELINYFPYDYAPPTAGEASFASHVTVMPTPWNDDTKLLHIGIKGYEIPQAEKPRSNLVFLLDTSGSMNQPNKLPLLKNAFRMLVQSLEPEDTVSIVTYAGSAGTVLKPTEVSDQSAILAALDRLHAGGSTAGGEGIRQAYRLAEQSFDAEGVNRVILATDGDFNVGITDPEQLQDFVERKRDSGVFLSVLGFGRGNYNDQLMQVLAQNGNGVAAYIDTLSEARKVLVEEAGSTLFPIAKDVKIQIEFNPATISEYRLIGYETRLLNREDFNNDRVDAGEIGSGHTVTALYEIAPVGSDGARVDPLRYQSQASADGPVNEFAFLKMRYKAPDGDTSKLIERSITGSDEVVPDAEARFAAAVAAFGQLLKGGRYTGDFSYADVIELANGAKGSDAFGYRAEFVTLVRLAETAAALPAQRQ
ncbi:MAG: von Willebrand factor type A domain-containing protein [Paracoccaceae bacterium]